MIDQKQPYSSTYFVDGKKVDPALISKAITEAQQTGKRQEALKNTFHLMQLLEDHDKNQKAHENQIKSMLKSNLVLNHEDYKPAPLLDPAKEYPLSKLGNFGKLERMCKIVDDGILEHEDEKKETKLKEIKDFLNKIQSKNGNKNQKLDWHSKGNEYPYRIILIDSNKHQKGIYFNTKQQAEKVRIHYVSKFRIKINVENLMSKVHELCYKEEIVEKFTKKVLFRHRLSEKKEIKQPPKQQSPKKEKSQIKEHAKSIIFSNPYNQDSSPERKEDDPPFIMEDNKSNRQIQQSNIKKSRFQSNYLNQLLQKESRMSMTQILHKNFNSNLFSQLEEQHRQHFFLRWKEAAYVADLEKSRISQISQISAVKKSERKVEQSSLFKKSIIKEKKPSYQEIKFKPSESNLRKEGFKEGWVKFCDIQFLKLTDIFMKPIITVALVRGGHTQYEAIFNTILKAKQPYLQYQLLVNNGEQICHLNQKINNYTLQIQAVDYLSNAQLCKDEISLRTKGFSKKTLILNEKRTVRIHLNYEDGLSKGIENEKDSMEGSILQLQPLSESIIQKIRDHWTEESSKKGYYNMRKDIKIFEILELSDEIPPSWALGLSEEEYDFTLLIDKASKIIGFKLLESILPISRALKKLFSSLQDVVDSILSIIVNYVRPYYFPEEFGKLQKFHINLGLEGDITFPSKIQLEMDVMKRMIQLQSPVVFDKFTRRNINYTHLLYEYIYELFSRNFAPNTLVEIWNFCFKDPASIQMYFNLLSVWLFKFYAQKLMKCRRFRQIRSVLESQQICPAEVIIRQVIILRQKYFGSSKSFLDEIKNIFLAKPLEPVLVHFYKKESEKIDKRKENNDFQKSNLMKKIQKQLELDIPRYPSKIYSLHIYFKTLPSQPGTLSLETNKTSFQCLNYEQKRYFILGEVSSQIQIKFVDQRENKYSCLLSCVEGINIYTADLINEKDNSTIKLEYVCGLLSERSFEAIKRNKNLKGYIGSHMTSKDLMNTLLKNVQVSQFLNKKKYDRDPNLNLIKMLFSSENRLLNQVQIYLRWIAVSSLTLPQKVSYIQEYASNLSEEQFLCRCGALEKILLRDFLHYLDFPLSKIQFQSYYSDSVEYELDAPKIYKCRFFVPSGREVKLEATMIKYFCEKNSHHLFEDLVIDEMFEHVKPIIENELGNNNEGLLTLLYSSQGEIQFREYQVLRKGREILINEEKMEVQLSDQDLLLSEPEVLMNEILPTFSKISSILDFVNQGRMSVEGLKKNKEVKNVPESINILKKCQPEFRRILLLRYKEYPKLLTVPFLQYYHSLIETVDIPHFPKNILINNSVTDLKVISSFNKNLNFTDKRKLHENTPFLKTLGIYGNFRKLYPNAQTVYFIPDIEEGFKPNALFFANYGYGVYRWEPCLVKSYRFKIQQKSSNLSSEPKPRKEYLVLYRNEKLYVRNHQLKIEAEIEERLEEIQNVRKTKIRKNDPGFSRTLVSHMK